MDTWLATLCDDPTAYEYLEKEELDALVKTAAAPRVLRSVIRNVKEGPGPDPVHIIRGAALGAAMGALVGAKRSDPGERGKGALQGAGIGAGAGAGVGSIKALSRALLTPRGGAPSLDDLTEMAAREAAILHPDKGFGRTYVEAIKGIGGKLKLLSPKQKGIIGAELGAETMLPTVVLGRVKGKKKEAGPITNYAIKEFEKYYRKGGDKGLFKSGCDLRAELEKRVDA
jgi:hypothetical protein